MELLNTTRALRIAAGLAIFAGILACGGDAEPTHETAASEQLEQEVSEAGPADRSAPNTAPRIEWVRFEPEAPTVGADLRALVEVTDAEGDAIFLRYTWKVAEEQTQDESSKVRLLGASKGDDIEVIVVASDGKDESESVSARTEVANSPPRLLRVSLSPAKELASGMDVVATPEGRDPDAEAVTFKFEWRVNGRKVDEQSPVLNTANLRRGDTVRVSVVGNPIPRPRIDQSNCSAWFELFLASHPVSPDRLTIPVRMQ